MVRWVAAAFLFAASSVSASVPPPPAPGAMDTYKRIGAAPSKDEIEKYVLLFSPSVTVTVNGKKVATSRDEWKAYLLQNAGWSIKRHLISYGNPVLIADSVFLPYDGCCLHTRFSVYHFDEDNLVDQVNRTDGGTFWDGLLKP